MKLMLNKNGRKCISFGMYLAESNDSAFMLYQHCSNIGVLQKDRHHHVAYVIFNLFNHGVDTVRVVVSNIDESEPDVEKIITKDQIKTLDVVSLLGVLGLDRY